MSNLISINNKVVVEPYKGSNKPVGKVSSGFATVKQKDTLIGLKVLADFTMKTNSSEILIVKGQTVYFSEEVLATHDWAKKTYECDAIEGRFSLAEAAYMVLVK